MPFEVVHRTRYAYAAPVTLGPHRLMLRPRDSHDLRLLDAGLTISPPATVTWRHDVFGNSIGMATFDAPTDELLIESRLVLERYPLPLDRDGEGPGRRYPFTYDADDRTDLGALTTPERLEEEETVRAWIRERVGDVETAGMTATDLLGSLSSAVHAGLTYEAREAEGTQTAAETIARGAGTCRDYAQLMIEAARVLGFGARFVTGYLYCPALDAGAQEGRTTVGAAATHAWAEVFAPDEGWIAFDPTNDAVESRDLIRVASVRSARQAAPISGSFTGTGPGTMEVTVEIREVPGPRASGGAADGPGERAAEDAPDPAPAAVLTAAPPPPPVAAARG
jgi:transglutaminase-like putative cysteine protease